MRYKDIIAERYTSDNKHFLDYMKGGDDFDPYTSWYYVCEFCEENGYLDDVSAITGEEVEDADAMREFEPDIFYKLEPSLQKEIAEWATEQHMRDDPAEAPTTTHMSLQKPQLLPRTTWLAHFTDDPWSIWSQGFTYGMDQMDKLGLTTYFKADAKKYGGYNFAFEAQSRHASWAASQGKYGRKGVMLFQNSGVKCWHYSDEEDQIVFWGKDVDPKDIIMVTHDDGGDWTVRAVRDLPGDRGDALFTGEYDRCVKWVIKNADTYRKYLFNR